MHTTVYEIDKHQEPTIQDRELYSISYNKLYGKESEIEYISMGLPEGSAVKNPSAMQETQSMWVQSLDLEEPLEKEMSTHSSIAWGIRWTEKPSSLQSMGPKESDMT